VNARLFVALELPAHVRAELLRWARAATRVAARAGGLRVLDGEALHLTLCFLGSRPLAEVDDLAEALREAAAGGFAEREEVAGGELQLELGAPLWLPPRRPLALAIEVHDLGRGSVAGEQPRGGHAHATSSATSRLAGLQARVSAALAEVSEWEPQRRRFRPHITVARVRRGAAPRRRELEPTPQLRFAATALVLYRSHLLREAAEYEALARVELE
jgi:2'-5' RNA ligase